MRMTGIVFFIVLAHGLSLQAVHDNCLHESWWAKTHMVQVRSRYT